MEKTYIIAHMIDVDGILCHALLEDILSPHFEVAHLDFDYDFYEEPFDKLIKEKPSGKIIRLVDAAQNKNFEKIKSIEELANLGNTLEIYDEHDWPLDSQAWKFFAKMCVASNPTGEYKDYNKISAAHILVKEFKKQYPQHAWGAIHDTYALLGDTADYNLENKLKPFSEDLQLLISSGYDKMKLIQHLAKADKNLEPSTIHSLWNQDLEDAKASCLKKIDDAKESLLSRLLHFSIGGVSSVIGYSSDILYMKPAMQALKQKEKGFSACIFESGKVVFSKDPQFTQSDINCGEIGKLFSGGGRELGGGGYLGKQVQRSDFEFYATIVIRKLHDYYQNKKLNDV